MEFLDDETVKHLRALSDWPELSGDRYRILEKIGQGGMGSIFRAEDRTLGRDVALKVLATPNATEEGRARMLREANVLARLEHPGIVPIHDAGTLADGRTFYTMKLVRGQRLDAFARGAQADRVRLSVFLRVCETVAFAHAQGVIHRDLKPENIMVGPFGEVLVLDWGVAKLIAETGVLSDPSRYDHPTPPPESPSPNAPGRRTLEAPESIGTQSGSVLGTPGFMSPEQARGDASQVDERTDVYALGQVLRILVPAPHSRRLAAICEKATAEHPNDRYRSATDFANDLVRLQAGESVDAYRESIVERAGRVLERHKIVATLILAYLLLRAGFLLYQRWR